MITDFPFHIKFTSMYKCPVLALFSALASCTVVTSCTYAQDDTFLQSYGSLSTIAGKGDVDNGGENGWSASYEGGKAIEAELSRPHMAMADSAGNIYIADKDAHAIRKVDPEGIITTVAGTSTAGNGGEGTATGVALNAPNGLWVNRQGEFYILDLNNNKIRKVDTEGQMTTLLEDPGGISLGRGLWLNDSEDTLWYASGSRIKMWTESGGIESYAEGFSGLGNITRDKDRFLIATDRSANRVYRVDSEGNKTVIAGNGSTVGGGDGYPALETAFYGVRGVWFLEDNTCFLATHEGSQIWYIDADGISHLFLNGLEGDEYHSGDGEHYQSPGYKISEARSVTVDYEGNVLITENDRGFIRKVEKGEIDALVTNPSSPIGDLRVITDPLQNRVQFIFSLKEALSVNLAVYDQSGKLIKQICNNLTLPGGPQKINWEAASAPAGIYFYLLHSRNTIRSGKFILRN